MKEIVQDAAISLRLPQTLLKKLDAQAKKEQRTRGNLIRVLLEKALEKKGGRQ
jgi:metal-responsive CopG/Arc/MetJ family transcriptional regulator